MNITLSQLLNVSKLAPLGLSKDSHSCLNGCCINSFKKRMWGFILLVYIYNPGLTVSFFRRWTITQVSLSVNHVEKLFN